MRVVRACLLASVVAGFTAIAHAQPEEPQPDAASSEPAADEPDEPDEPGAATVPPPADLARGYERPPREPTLYGGSVLRGLGTGVGYVVRGVLLPFRGLIYAEARWGVFTAIRDVFENDAGTIALYPNAAFISGFGASVGAQAFYKDFGGHDEKLSANVTYGGADSQAYQLKLEMPHIAGTPIYTNVRLRFEEADDQFFQGIGNGDAVTGMDLDARDASIETRFSEQRWLAVLSTGVERQTLGGRVHFGTSFIFNDRTFAPLPMGATGTSIEQVYDTSTVAGFDEGFDNLEITADVELDTRDTEGPTGAGGVARGFFGGGSPISDVRYIHYGTELAYHWTPALPGRVLVARVAHEGVRDEDADLPFTELPRLGGAGLLRGYHEDRFRDRLATIGTLEYHYPIHANVSGQLFVETGKVARSYTELFDDIGGDWHHGYGAGLIIHTPSAVKVRLDVAYGDGVQFYFSTDVLNAFRRREKEL